MLGASLPLSLAPSAYSLESHTFAQPRRFPSIHLLKTFPLCRSVLGFSDSSVFSHVDSLHCRLRLQLGCSSSPLEKTRFKVNHSKDNISSITRLRNHVPSPRNSRPKRDDKFPLRLRLSHNSLFFAKFDADSSYFNSLARIFLSAFTKYR